MAVKDAKNPTIYDVLEGQADGKTITDVVNILAQDNPILEDAATKECNQNDQNKEMVTTSLPTITRRKYNQGVDSSKGTRAPLIDSTAIYSARCEVDEDLASLNGGTREFLMRENEDYLEAMAQATAHDLFYGAISSGNDGIIGFAERYNSLTRKNASGIIPETADYIIDAGGTSNDLSSIWLVVWGLKTCFTIYPKGSKAGLEIVPTRRGDAFDKNNKPYPAHITEYKQKIGLCVKDLRTVVRIANIDVEAISADTGDKTVLVKSLIKAYTRCKKKNTGRPIFYCNSDVQAAMWTCAVDRSNVLFNTSEVEGNPVIKFQGIPIKACDALLNTETQVV